MVTLNDCRQLGEHEYKGFSTDTKPTSCAVNSIFLELDTGNFYYFDGEEWQKIGGQDMNYYDILFARKMAGGQGEITTEGLSVTENGTYTAPEGKAYTPVVVNVSGYKIKDIPNTPTAIATFNASALPMPSLKVGIEPQQDFHGYDAPWVGGAGKNKYPDTQDINLGGTNPRIVGYAISVPIGAGTYVISWKTTGEVTPHLQMEVDGVYNTSLHSGSSFTVTSSVNQCYWYITTADYDANKTVHIYDIQIESGSTATSYAPYSNICPISGHTETNVIVSPTTDAEDGTTYNVQFKDGDNPLTVYGGTLDVVSGVLTVDRGFYTISSNTALVGFTESSIYGSYAIISSIGNQKANISEVCAIASEAKGVSYNDRVAEPTIDRVFTNEQGGVILRASNNVSISDSTTFLSYFNGCQICYELATPQTYQLNPTLVKSLLNTNNIWANTGDVLEGSYFKELQKGGKK